MRKTSATKLSCFGRSDRLQKSVRFPNRTGSSVLRLSDRENY